MSRAGTLGLSEVGVEAAAGLRAILEHQLGDVQAVRYVYEDPISWSVISEGGWDLLGAPAADDGADATLRDLVEIARVWGWAIAPTPYIPSLIAKRWSNEAREHEAPVTFAVRTRTSGETAAVPFGRYPGALLLGDVQRAGLTSGRLSDLSVDEYAPSLLIGEGVATSTWAPEASYEMRVVWASEAVGAAARMLVTGVEYTKVREQFGQSIGHFQALKHQMADALALVELAETAVILASQDRERAAAATRYAFDASLKVAEMAIQVHGGIGFTWEMGLHMYVRHISALRELAAGLPA